MSNGAAVVEREKTKAQWQQAIVQAYQAQDMARLQELRTAMQTSMYQYYKPADTGIGGVFEGGEAEPVKAEVYGLAEDIIKDIDFYIGRLDAEAKETESGRRWEAEQGVREAGQELAGEQFKLSLSKEDWDRMMDVERETRLRGGLGGAGGGMTAYQQKSLELQAMRDKYAREEQLFGRESWLAEERRTILEKMAEMAQYAVPQSWEHYPGMEPGGIAAQMAGPGYQSYPIERMPINLSQPLQQSNLAQFIMSLQGQGRGGM